MPLKPGQTPEHIANTRPADIKKLKAEINYDLKPHHRMCSTCEHYRGPTPHRYTHCDKHQILIKPTARCKDFEERF